MHCRCHEVEHLWRQAWVYAHPKHIVHHKVAIVQIASDAVLAVLISGLADKIATEEEARSNLVRFQGANQFLSPKGCVFSNSDRETKP